MQSVIIRQANIRYIFVNSVQKQDMLFYKKYNDAECNVELLKRRLIKELEMLYNKFMVENI